MNKVPRVFPVWLFPMLVFIAFAITTCQGCRGGISLGKGSAGTVIKPSTPAEINKKNNLIPKGNPAPVKEEVTREEIHPSSPALPVPLPSYKTKPDFPNVEPAEAEHDNLNPKASNPISPPISPTINRNAPPVSVTMPTPQKESDNKATTQNLSLGLSNDNQVTTNKPKQKDSIDIAELALWYLFIFIILFTIYVIYDMASDKLREKKKLEPILKKKAKKINSKKKSTTKKKSTAKKKSAAKNEKLEKYKAKIPKGRFYKKK
tara:strand:+ start:1468 stop:2253 length:786 start_codon:yes stop_codon:yes gene_type:complete